MDIIITAPHSGCIRGSQGRMCDLRAEYAATRIGEYMQKRLPTAHISVAYSDVVRADIDLNRAPARYTKWRQQILESIDASVAVDRKVLVLDIHSFPDTSKSFGYMEDGTVPSVVLLDFPGIRSNYEPPPFVRVLEASLANDIIVTSLLSGADAFLWEFNENPMRSTNQVIDTVAESMQTYALRISIET